jgi:hypothetical protein
MEEGKWEGYSPTMLTRASSINRRTDESGENLLITGKSSESAVWTVEKRRYTPTVSIIPTAVSLEFRIMAASIAVTMEHPQT